MFSGVYKGGSVLVLGHTGFKGSWLSSWLIELGARVTGASLDVPTVPSLFEVVGLDKQINHRTLDVRDLKALERLVNQVQPDFVFYLLLKLSCQRHTRPQ